MIFLRQSTASQEIPLGRFVDSTDGNTEETALSIANTDIKIWKTGATTLASKNSGGATHIANGEYYCVLDATDTDTIGPLKVTVHVAGALYVQVFCTVLDEAVYDALFGTVALATATNITAATGVDITKILGTAISTPATAGILDVNLKNIANAAVSTSSAQLGVNVVSVSGDSVAADNLEAALDGTGGVTISAALTGNITGNLSGSVGSVAAGGIAASTFAAGAIDAAALAADAGTELGTAVWASATRVLTANTNLNDLSAAGIRTAVGLASANLDTQLAAIVADTNELQTDWANGGRLDLILDAAAAIITTAMTESYAALGATQTPAQILYEIRALLAEKTISSTTLTTKKLNGSTTAHTYTLNDATTPTAITTAS